jgi:hypothetical protein
MLRWPIRKKIVSGINSDYPTYRVVYFFFILEKINYDIHSSPLLVSSWALKSNRHCHTLFLLRLVIFFFHLHIGLPNDLLPSGFAAKILTDIKGILKCVMIVSRFEYLSACLFNHIDRNGYYDPKTTQKSFKPGFRDCNTSVRMKGIQNKKFISRKLTLIHVSGLYHRKGKLWKCLSCPAYAHAPAGDFRRAQ